MYRNRKRKSRKKRRLFTILILLILILAYILFLSPLFKIRTIEAPNVSDRGEISLEQLKNGFNYKNIFLYTKNKIKSDLIAKFPIISDIEINKNILKTSIKLEIKEREKTGIICTMDSSYAEASEDKCFYIDKQGIIFEQAPQTSGSLILLIKDYSQRNFYLGKKVFDKKIIDIILEIGDSLFSKLDVRTLDFNILSFPPKDLKVMTNEGWYIIFDLEEDIDNQLLSLEAAIQEKIQNRQELEYVDLRVKNRVYYK